MSGFVEPDYGGATLGNVVPAIAAALGCPLPDAAIAAVLPDAPSYVLFLIDGLGARLLERYAHVAPFLSSLLHGESVGLAGVPSTTVTSLTSLGTGLPPGAHGIVGYTTRVPGTGRLLNALQWSKSVDPHQWQPNRTIWQRLGEVGVTATIVNKREFKGSGLTEATQRGADYVDADRVGERIAAALTVARTPRSLTYMYDGDLDWTGHKHGVASTAWLQQLGMIDAEAEQLRESLPAATRLVVVADHGMVDSPTAQRIDVDDHPTLRDGVALIGGEARFRHLYCANGAVDDVAACWAEVLGDRAEVLTRDQAIGRGWFGMVVPTVLPRLGDVLVASRGDHAVVSRHDFAYETTLVGLHGSLTPDEMFIPILVS